MRVFLLSLLGIFFPILGWAQSGEYVVVEIHPTSGTFVGKSAQALHTFRVRAGSEISINDQEAAFAEVAVGMKVKVESADPGVATKITAYGTRTAAVSIVAQPPASASPTATRLPAQTEVPPPDYFGVQAPATRPAVSEPAGGPASPTTIPRNSNELTDLLVGSVWKTSDGTSQIEFAKDGPAVLDHGRSTPKWWCVDAKTFHLWNKWTVGKIDPAGTSFEIKYGKKSRQTYMKVLH